MRKPVVTTDVSSEGFLLLNSSLSPIVVNRTAAEILCYPQRPETENLDRFLQSKLQSTLFSGQSWRVPALAATFKSGRRFYQCRAYRVNALAKGDPQVSVAVLLERNSGGLSSVVQVSQKFNLTSREQEVLRHLYEGRTTKEIAVGMKISPNTVKAFLHLIMVKMGVSTRSAIVGKALTATLSNPSDGLVPSERF